MTRCTRDSNKHEFAHFHRKLFLSSVHNAAPDFFFVLHHSDPIWVRRPPPRSFPPLQFQRHVSAAFAGMLKGSPFPPDCHVKIHLLSKLQLGMNIWIHLACSLYHYCNYLHKHWKKRHIPLHEAHALIRMSGNVHENRLIPDFMEKTMAPFIYRVSMVCACSRRQRRRRIFITVREAIACQIGEDSAWVCWG